MKRYLIILCMFATGIHFSAGSDAEKMTRKEYIALYKDDAIRDMKKTGVPASITMAQALLESNDGNSPLAKEANNHFGIKCSDWTGPYYIQDDDKKDECFRKYGSVLESYDDHSNFLKTRSRYSILFELDITDYKGWARGLKKAGYATDSRYADRLIKIIEDYRLYLLDQGENLPLYAGIQNTPPVKQEDKSPEIRTVYVPPVSVIDAFSSHRIEKINGIEAIIARKGDSFESLRKEFELGSWQLPKYNETSSSSPLSEGQVVYLKPKSKSSTKAYYIVKEGDTVYSISQDMGIRKKFLLKYNSLNEQESLSPGSKLLLRKPS